jgi:hypothetical protein
MLKRLKTALFANDIDYAYLSKKLGRSKDYICDRMTGRKAWNIEEIYVLCDMLDIPYIEIPEYFPRGGKTPAIRRAI